MATAPARVAIFLHSGDYDRVHQGLSIAAAAAAAGRPVDVFFFWWALERLARKRLDEPDFDPPREDVVDRFEKLRAPTLADLLRHLSESGKATFYACSGSAPLVGVDPSRMGALQGPLDSIVQTVGWTRILQLTQGVTDRFYL